MFRSFACALALTAATALASNEDPYSREGRDLAFLVALNGPALTSPSTSLGLAQDSTQEPKYANRITPVGQRQQFLIGSELRRRYVEEAQFLSEEYIISQLYLQAPFVAKNILSLQAQMMGLYPSTHANDLTEWQQENAVPPIEGADFSEWQKELGAYALPHGLQTFPIQQAGFEADFVLSLSQKNCKLYDGRISPTLTTLSTSLDTILANDFADIWSEMQEKDVSGVELCDYLTWAHYNAVPLVGEAARQDQYSKLVTDTCPSAYYNQKTQAVQSVNEATSNLVTSGFLARLVENMGLAGATGELKPNDLHLGFTNYQALDSDILLVIATQVLEGVDGSKTLPASSSLIFEVGTDKSVRGYLNDVEYTPFGCAGLDVCTSDRFLAAVQTRIGIADPATACATTSIEEHLFIQN